MTALIVDGLEITRVDFFVQTDGAEGVLPTVIVNKLAQTPSNGNHVVLASERKPVDLEAAQKWLERNGYSTRRWVAAGGRPAGMRAWLADKPWPVRPAGQIARLRQQLGVLGHSLNLAFDL